MDSKKTNLTPELKEIYDRVMNTSTAGSATTNNGALPTTPTAPNPTPVADAITPSPSTPIAPPLPSSGMPPLPNAQDQLAPPTLAVNPTLNNAAPTMPTLEMPATPTIGEQASPIQGGLASPIQGGLASPIGGPTPAEQALTNTPARPLSEGNTFAFGGGHPAPAPTAPGAEPPKEKKKAKISLPMIIVAGILFIVVWGVFWAIIFGFIQR